MNVLDNPQKENLREKKLRKEIEKLEAETFEIRKRSASVWTPRIIQVTIGTIIAVAAISAFVMSTVLPAINMNVNLATIKNQLQAAKNDSIQQEISRARENFALQLAELEEANRSFENDANELRVQLEKEREEKKRESLELQRQMEDLTLSAREREASKRQRIELEAELSLLTKKKNELEIKQKASEKRSAYIKGIKTAEFHKLLFIDVYTRDREIVERLQRDNPSRGFTHKSGNPPFKKPSHRGIVYASRRQIAMEVKEIVANTLHMHIDIKVLSRAKTPTIVFHR